jgi:hypothetical protein
MSNPETSRQRVSSETGTSFQPGTPGVRPQEQAEVFPATRQEQRIPARQTADKEAAEREARISSILWRFAPNEAPEAQEELAPYAAAIDSIQSTWPTDLEQREVIRSRVQKIESELPKDVYPAETAGDQIRRYLTAAGQELSQRTVEEYRRGRTHASDAPKNK